MFGQSTPIGGNKRVCSFFAKGTCKYGTQCWNLHIPNQHLPNQAVGGMANTFGVGSNVFGAKTSTQPDSKEFTEFVKQVSGEMTQWERSGQWLFSSFAPLKSHPMLGGFLDLSPEELRGKAYEALKTSTSSAYQDHWSKLQQEYKQLRDALRVPTPEAYQAMKEVFHAKGNSEQQQTQTSSQAVKQTSLFGKPSVFGGGNVAQPQPGAGLLGAKPQSSPMFGGGSLFGANQSTNTSLFGDAPKKPLFGATPALGSQNTTTFGTQPNASPFGGGNNNLFQSGTSNTLSGGSLFGAPPKIQGNTLFGGSTGTNTTPAVSGNIFGGGNASNTTPATGNIFGGGSSTNATTSATANIFGSASTPNTTTQAAGSIFGSATTPNTTTQTTGGIFGGGASTNTTTPATASIFGGGQNQTTNIFGNSSGNQNQTPTFGIGSVAGSNMFGGANTTTSLFGTPGSTGQPASVFGNKPSIFGGPQQTQSQQQQNPSLFGAPPASTPGLFGTTPLTTNTQTQNATPSIFGGNATGSNFTMTPGSAFTGGGAAPNQSGGSGLFGNAPSSGMQASSSLFGNAGESPSAAAGLFGKPPESQQTPQTTMLSVGNKGSADRKAEWFTPLDKLDPADKAQFEADAFTSIPLCAPPLELCF